MDNLMELILEQEKNDVIDNLIDVYQRFIDLAKESYVDLKSIIITIIIGIILVSKKVHPILVIVIAAILGLIFYL